MSALAAIAALLSPRARGEPPRYRRALRDGAAYAGSPAGERARAKRNRTRGFAVNSAMASSNPSDGNPSDAEQRRAYRRELRGVARLLRYSGIALALVGAT